MLLGLSATWNVAMVGRSVFQTELLRICRDRHKPHFVGGEVFAGARAAELHVRNVAGFDCQLEGWNGIARSLATRRCVERSFVQQFSFGIVRFQASGAAGGGPECDRD